MLNILWPILRHYYYPSNLHDTGLRSAVSNVSTADPGVVNKISVRSHTFVEVDHEIISTAIFLPSADSRSYKQKYVHEVLVNRLVKLAQEKSIVR